jgi:outer membrane lipoprotein SlyB
VKHLLLAALAAAVVSGCANRDPYEDSMYTLQRNLQHRNERWDRAMERTYLRNQARDERYNSWFNAIME